MNRPSQVQKAKTACYEEGIPLETLAHAPVAAMIKAMPQDENALKATLKSPLPANRLRASVSDIP
jgi:hypothetical protein